MIQSGDGTFAILYAQGRCPKCRSYMSKENDIWVCPVCKMTHKGVEIGNRTQSENGNADDF